MTHPRIAILLESHLERSPTDTGYDPTWYAMRQLLAHAGIDEGACYFDYLVSAKVDVKRLKWAGTEVQEGLAALATRLAAYQPHFVLLLDRHGYLLRAFFGERRSVDDWKGSVLLATHTMPGVKTMATYSPTRLRLDYGLTGVVRHHLQRVVAESRTDTLDVPVDDIAIDLTKDELVARLRDIYDHDRYVAVDLEGVPDFITCIGFATGPNTAFVVPFVRADGTSWWSEEDEVELWGWVARVLEKPTVGKACHNALYELFCLAWSYGIVIDGLEDDTMVMWFELFCELEKDLGFCTVMLTQHPWYKFERKATDDYTQLRYNGKDCCRTFEIKQRMDGMLKPKQREHYKFNVSLLAPLAYMSLRGIRYDHESAKARLAEVQEKIYELQDEINQEAARSPEREELKQFFQALGSESRISSVGERGSTGEGCIQALLPLLTAAFCCCERNRKEWREVEEVSWQPMRWNGKKWVRAGKREKEITDKAADILTGDEAVDATTPKDQIAWREVTKRVKKCLPVAVETLEDVRRFAKDSQRDACKRTILLCEAVRDRGATPAQRGELATLLGIHVKISASGRDRDEELDNGTIERGDERDANWYLYEHLKLPKQYIKDGIRNTDKLASDAEAVIKAWIQSGKTEAARDPRALTFIKLKKLLTETKSLRAQPDHDGRIRCSYNLVGTETHRLSCSGSPTRTSKLNLQTVTKSHRDLYRADEGCWLGQRDLSGADGWTVAAYAAMLGDRTMLEDYQAKLKPAQIIVLMLDRGAAVNAIPRDQLKPLCKPITEEADWRYFAMKRVQHGSSYMMGRNTTSDQILTDAYKKDGKPLYLAPAECERIQQQCFFVRYPGIKQLHEWMGRQLIEAGSLTASNGFTRQFYGRKKEQARVNGCMIWRPVAATQRQALAHLPQVYTTYATTLAIKRLWVDVENRREDGSLVVEPLHTVHDSLVPQWRKEDTEFAKTKLAAWFDNPIQIANEMIVIPASGTYGPSWGEQDQSL